MLVPRLHLSFKSEMKQRDVYEKILYNIKHSNYHFEILSLDYPDDMYIMKIKTNATNYYRDIKPIVTIKISKENSYTLIKVDCESQKFIKIALSIYYILLVILQAVIVIKGFLKDGDISVVMFTPMIMFFVISLISPSVARVCFGKVLESLLFDILQQ